ncbi:MAG: hypothetical protein QNI84_07240 [Henriciella sp.]|nr:hypothetical protein [Henriciella sp.]
MRTCIITPQTLQSERASLKLFHQLRHEIFIGSVERPDLTSVGKLEYDIWDTPLFDSVRFLLLDDDNRPIGVARLVPSEQLTMLEANHQEFMWKMHDKRPDLWEIQRLGIVQDLDPITMERAILFLLVEISTWCLENDITKVMLLTYSGIANKRLETMTRMGPELPLVGAPHVALVGTLDPHVIEEWAQRYRSLTNTAPRTTAA